MHEVTIAGMKAPVQLTPMTYAQWEELEAMRQDALEEAVGLEETGKVGRAQLVLARKGSELRSKKMALCVVGWEKVQTLLTVRQVALLEKEIDALNKPEVELGNFADGSPGGATAAA